MFRIQICRLMPGPGRLHKEKNAFAKPRRSASRLPVFPAINIPGERRHSETESGFPAFGVRRSSPQDNARQPFRKELPCEEAGSRLEVEPAAWIPRPAHARRPFRLPRFSG